MSVLLQVQDLSKSFTDNVGLLGGNELRAVYNISFSLEKQQNLAIIGKNGSGKSTLARMIVGITQPTSGKILFNGSPLEFGDYKRRASHIRMVFQDPNSAFDPKLNVGQILDAPLRLLTYLEQHERNDRIFETLRLVGLYPAHANIKITAMSLSQKQRVALARALILEPEIIIIDDVLSSLDASVKTQMTNLMMEVQRRLGISYIYIGQHIGLIKHTADNILVLDEGQMIEYGTTRDVFTQPRTEITKRLIESYFGHELDESAFAV